MIELNLLPLELRKKKSAFSFEKLPDAARVPMQFLSRLPLRLVGFYAGGALLVLYTLAVLGVFVNQHALNRLKKEWEQVAPQREKINLLSSEYAELDAVEKAVQKLNHHFSWSKKLQDLSGAMVRGVWLRELSIGERHRDTASQQGATGGVGKLPEKLLILTGSAASSKGDQTAVVGRFIRSLKENQDFFSDFTNVELESIKRRSIQSQDVMDFKIICTFKEGIVE